ncbi:MAG: hypothetical protein L3J58_01175 [Emcibacter sp.]|nr:hypothetical protein [Emcibacter sp.]
MTVGKFLKIWFIGAMLTFGIAVAFNYYVDPYALFGSQRIAGFNKIKPAAGSHSFQSKIHTAHKQEIDLLIIGNSRAEMGIDPDHSLFKKKKIRAYNLGQPGSQISTQYGYALDILREKEIKTIIISVDFLDFITSKHNVDPYNWPPEKSSQDNRRKYNWDGSINDSYTFQYFKDVYVPLIALGTLQDSFRTIFSQNANSSNLLQNGFNPAANMLFATQNEGVTALFNQKIPQVITSFTARKFKIYTDGYQWSPQFNALKFFLDYLQSQDIEVIIFINPYHIQYLEIIEYSGLTEAFSTWKIQLVQIVENRHKKITLWNFSDPSSYTNEPILLSGNKPLKWFWEPAHYRKELGDLIVQNIFSEDIELVKDTRQFGHILTSENISAYLAEYSVKLKKYRTEYPEESKSIAQKFRELTK